VINPILVIIMNKRSRKVSGLNALQNRAPWVVDASVNSELMHTYAQAADHLNNSGLDSLASLPQWRFRPNHRAPLHRLNGWKLAV